MVQNISRSGLTFQSYLTWTICINKYETVFLCFTSTIDHFLGIYCFLFALHAVCAKPGIISFWLIYYRSSKRKQNSFDTLLPGKCSYSISLFWGVKVSLKQDETMFQRSYSGSFVSLYFIAIFWFLQTHIEVWHFVYTLEVNQAAQITWHNSHDEW